MFYKQWKKQDLERENHDLGYTNITPEDLFTSHFFIPEATPDSSPESTIDLPPPIPKERALIEGEPKQDTILKPQESQMQPTITHPDSPVSLPLRLEEPQEKETQDEPHPTLMPPRQKGPDPSKPGKMKTIQDVLDKATTAPPIHKVDFLGTWAPGFGASRETDEILEVTEEAESENSSEQPEENLDIEIAVEPLKNSTGSANATYADYRRWKPSRHISTYVNLPDPPAGNHTPEGYTFPATLHQALTDPYSKKWLVAIEKEHGQIKEKGVYEIVEPPPNAKIMDSKWVFVVKYNIDKSVDKFKARLCAKGFSSIPGIHHNETYAPTAPLAAARLMFALGAGSDAEIHQMDVSGAFLYGDLEEEIYMLPPPGLEEPDNKVWKLKKSLYGLKQAPRVWHKMLHSVLTNEGFKQSKIEPTLYILQRQGESTHTLVFVDDLLLLCTNKGLLDNIKKVLMTHFDMTDLGPSEKYLGWHVQRDRVNKKVWLSLEKKIREGVISFGLQDATPTATPLPTDYKALLPHEVDLENPDREPLPGSNDKFSPLLDPENHSIFRQMTGFIQYIAQALRPDVAFAANQLAAVQHKPRERHLKGAVHCLRYLKGTATLGLCYSAQAPQELRGYTDSDFAGCPGTRKSTTGWIFTYAGAPISWKSKKQDCITTSSCEAEYVALTSGTKECLWLRDMLGEFGLSPTRPTPLHCDNEAAVRISRDTVCHSRTKHVSLSFWFVRERQEEKSIRVQSIPTKDQLADFLTKSLNKPIFNMNIQNAGLVEIPTSGSKKGE